MLILGFVIEGATEAYQFLERGNLSQGWPEYLFEPGNDDPRVLPDVPRAQGMEVVPLRASDRWTGTAAEAVALVRHRILDHRHGGYRALEHRTRRRGAGASTPSCIAWPVGGLVVLAFGSFFYRLRVLAQPVGPGSVPR